MGIKKDTREEGFVFPVLPVLLVGVTWVTWVTWVTGVTGNSAYRSATQRSPAIRKKGKTSRLPLSSG